MKKTILLSIILLGLTASQIYAQTLVEVPTTLTGVEGNSKWGDFDNDGDLDLGIIQKGTSGATFKLYQNNGDQTFTEISTGILALRRADFDWGDYDNNDTLDIIITGELVLTGYARIYKYTGGSFTDISAGLLGLENGSVEWGDYDNDNDLDVLISGRDISDNSFHTKVYRNDAGTFVDISAGITGVIDGTATWGDYDNNDSLDVVVVGQNQGGTAVAEIYKYSGGSFTNISAGLTGLSDASADWGDYDGDLDLDLIITGSGVTKLYRNDGSDTFTDVAHSMQGVRYGAAEWGDFDGDGDPDIALLGLNGSTRHTKFYRNDSGTFNELVTDIPGLFRGSIDWGDYNGDGFLDLVISGNNGSSKVTKVYNNLKFSQNATAALTGQGSGGGDWGDYDNDGDLDLIVVGYSRDGSTQATTQLYRNDGSNVFTSIAHSMLPMRDGASVQWGDYDNDGDLDIVLGGTDASSVYQTKIYRNDSGSFTDISAGLPGTAFGTLAWGDYDNDGDLDLLMTGFNSGGAGLISRIYQNNAGAFTDIAAGLTGTFRGSGNWGDYDGDGDLDILLTGNAVNADRNDSTRSIIYRNDSGSFTDISAGITPLGAGSSAWGDYDGDGDLDVVVSGVDASFNLHTLIYKNTGGTFTDISAGLTGVNESYADWGDYDNDGDLDLLISGSSVFGSNDGVTKLYRNQGSDTFMDVTYGLPILNPRGFTMNNEWGDYDNDGDLDFFVQGVINSVNPRSYIYENTMPFSNTAPGTPSNLVMTPGAGSLTFSWAAASDSEGGPLSYNVFMTNVDSSSSVVSGMSNSGTGYRRITGIGNAGHATSYSIQTSGLSDGLHTWGIQTIDGAGGSSTFTTHSFLHGSDGAVLTGTEGWRLLAMPAASPTFATTLSPFWTQGFTGASTASGSSNVYTWSDANATDDVSNWTVPGSLSESLPTGKGVLVYVYGDDNGPGTAGDAGFPKAVPFSGTEPSGDINMGSLLNPNINGRALLGNPYRSDVDWDSFTKTNLFNVVYIWDHNANAWKSWNGTVGSLTDGIIPAYNAFFVQTFSSSPALTIPEAAKVSGQRGVLGKAIAQKQEQPKALKLHAVSGGLTADAWISFQAGGEVGRDAFDGLALTPFSSSYLKLATVIGTGEVLQVNALPEHYDEELSLPLEITGIPDTTTATVSFEGLEHFGDWELSVLDTHTQESYPITEGITLTLEIDAVKAKKAASSELQIPASGKEKTTANRYWLILQPGVNVGIEDPAGLPTEVALEQNYPNPFNPSTTIAFGVPQTSKVTLEVFDMLGRKVATLINGETTAAGRYTVTFNAANLASGMYIYRLQTGNTLMTRKLTLIK